jgi:hypothetical protein
MDLENWFDTSYARANFERFVPQAPLRVLQIGAWTGDATSWLLTNREIISIDDVDTWSTDGQKLSFSRSTASGTEDELKITEAEKIWDDRFLKNSKVFKHKMDSNSFFQQNTSIFNFIYIDGDHTSIQTAIDGFMAFRFLSYGGVLAFDDYEWDLEADEYQRPKIGIDKFLKSHRVQVLDVAYQVWIQKV